MVLTPILVLMARKVIWFSLPFLFRREVIKSTQKQKRIFSLFSGLMILLLLIPTPTFAGRVSAVAGYTELKSIMTVVTQIFDSVLSVAAGITIFQIIMSRDQRAVNGAYKYMTTLIAVFVIFNLLGSIFLFIDTAIPFHTYKYS